MTSICSPVSKSQALPVLRFSDFDAENPRAVSRGLDLHSAFCGIDSLYVVVCYPSDDIFCRWARGVSLTDSRLFEGIDVDGFVLRKGSHGYPLSIWDGDARLYMTARVDDNLRGTSQQGQGMGLMLQLGSKWLRRWGDDWSTFIDNIYGQLQLFGVVNPLLYSIRLNRVDVCLDLMNFDISSLSVDFISSAWVGRSKSIDIHYTSNALNGLSFGRSSGSVRFKIYDKVLESKKRGTYDFWSSVWGCSPQFCTRFEFSFFPYRANFDALTHLPELSRGSLGSLVAYAFSWGRVAVPSSDSNRSRWETHPFWSALCSLFTRLLVDDTSSPVRRIYNYSIDMSKQYLRSLVGWLSGYLVRYGISQGIEEAEDLSFAYALGHLVADRGYTFADIEDNAVARYPVALNLAMSFP